MEISDLEDLVKKKHRAIRKGNLRGAVETGNELGFYYTSFGKHEEALEEYKQSLEFCVSNNDLMGQATAHRYIGETFSKIGSYKEALKHHRIYLELALKCKNQVEEQRAYTTVGNTHLDFAVTRMKDSEGRMALRKAEESFNFALNISEKVKVKVSREEYAQMRARLFMNLALVCELHQKEELCINYFQQSVKISEEYSLTEDLYRSLYNLSQYYKRCGKTKEAMAKCILSCNCAVKMKDDKMEMEALILMTKIHLSASEFKLAKEKLSVVYKKRHCLKTDEYKEAERMLKKVFKLLHLIEDLDSISKKDPKTVYPLYEKAGDKAVTLESYEFALCAYKNMEKCARALGMKGKELCPIYISIWKTLKDLHRYQESLTYLVKEERLELNNHKQLFKIFLEKADLLDSLGSNYEDVRDALASAHQQAELLTSAEKQIYSLRKLLSWQQRENKMDDSISTRNLLENLVGKEEMEKLSELSSPPHSDNEEDEDDYDSDDDLELDKEIDLCSDNETEEKAIQQNPKKNILGETQLHRASIEGNLRKVKALLDKGHPVNVRDNCGWLPIHEAASNGYLEISEILLDRGASLNDRGGDKCQGFTPLHDACSNAHVDVIELLVHRGADLLLKNDLGDLPINTLDKWCKEMKDEEVSTEVTKCFKMLSEATEIQRISLLKSFGVNKNNVIVNKQTVKDSSLAMSTLKKRAASPSNENNRTEDIHDVSSPESSHRRIKFKTIANKKSATKEYKEVMSKVKRPLVGVEDVADMPRPKMALVKESECVGLNDWLVNDVTCDSEGSLENTKYKQTNKKSLRKVVNRKLSLLDDDDDDDDNRSIRHEKEVVAAVDMDCGDDDYIKDNKNDEGKSSLAEKDDIKMSSTNVNKWINVTIGEKSLGVPFGKRDDQHAVSWLAEEASSRYYTIFGRKPRLTIMVRGMIMMPGDPLEGLFSSGDEIQVVASVDEWINVPVETVYRDACRKFSSSVCLNLQNVLVESERSGFLDFSENSLQLSQWRPICHVIQSLTSLTQLHLRGNKLRNEGFEILLDVFKCLPYLLVVDVSSNHMTHDSVGALSNHLKKYTTMENKPLQSLEVLMLANNSLLDISSGHLFDCLRHLPSLKRLSVSSCCFTEKFFQDVNSAVESLKGGLLNYLDLGGNDFERLDPNILIKCLNFSRLQTLKLPRVQFNFVQLLRKHMEEFNGNINFRFLSIDGKPTL